MSRTMQPKFEKYSTRWRTFLALIFLVNIGAAASEDCVDLYDWCVPNELFCHLEQVFKDCPKTCGTCLPPECSECSHTCSVTNGNVTCTCREGYQLQADGKNCEDIDECVMNQATECEAGQTCVNVDGDYDCINATSVCSPFLKDDYWTSLTYKGTCCKQSNDFNRCGRNNVPTRGGRIINGTNTKIEFWPWQVYFLLPRNQKCGGSLINDQWIVSAAHCFESVSLNDNNITVLLGLSDTTKSSDIDVRKRLVAEIIMHENYVFPVNDIALVRMNRKIKVSKFVSPICLPNGEIPKNDATCFITGYGTTDPDITTLPNTLQEASVPIVDSEVCRLAYKDFQHPVDTDKMICAGYKEGGIDACRGDSGGPLVCQRCSSCDWYLAGVTSYGQGCALANSYGVYTDVEYFEEWIASKIDSIDVSKKTCEPTEWSDWSNWSPCSNNCDGKQSRSRTCQNGIPGIPGCEGDTIQEKACRGGANQWTEWSECSTTCGGGEQTRQRGCTAKNVKTQRRACNTQQCTGWSMWGEWTSCTNPCGLGDQTRMRSCLTGLPGDSGCEGQAIERQNCRQEPSCTEWESWSSWSPCSSTCGIGMRTASRECKGSRWGFSCPGVDTKFEECTVKKTCGQWSDWSTWTDCTKNCESGTKTRSRFCSGGNDCEGPSTESVSCNTGPCFAWSQWSEWSSCSTTCEGTRSRSRICGQGNRNAGSCPGLAAEEEACGSQCVGTESCSPFCQNYVNSGFCSPSLPVWLQALCSDSCCVSAPGDCIDYLSYCSQYEISSCRDPLVAAYCPKHCGVCA